MASTALALVKKYGLPYTFILDADKNGTYNTATAKFESGSVKTASGYGVIVNYKLSEINGKSILAGDKKMVFVTSDEMYSGMTVELDGINWEVTDPSPVKPADVVLCYNLNLRV